MALPCGSTSTSSVLYPASAMQAATFTAVVVFPTPPFWFAMAYTVPMTALDASDVGGGARPGRARQRSSPCGQRAFCCDSRPAREIRRRGRDLPIDVQRPPLGARKGRHGLHPVRLESQSRRGREPVRGLLIADEALPRDQRTAIREQGSGVLAQHRERRQCPRADHLVRPVSVAPLLGPCVDHLDVGEPELRRRGSDEATLAPGALEQRQPRSRKRERQRQPGQPGARPEVGDPSSVANLREPQPRERVGKVHVDAPPASCTDVGASGRPSAARSCSSPRRAASSRAYSATSSSMRAATARAVIGYSTGRITSCPRVWIRAAPALSVAGAHPDTGAPGSAAPARGPPPAPRRVAAMRSSPRTSLRGSHVATASRGARGPPGMFHVKHLCLCAAPAERGLLSGVGYAHDPLRARVQPWRRSADQAPRATAEDHAAPLWVPRRPANPRRTLKQPTRASRLTPVGRGRRSPSPPRPRARLSVGDPVFHVKRASGSSVRAGGLGPLEPSVRIVTTSGMGG